MENKILENALLFAEERKSIYTGCLHYKNDKEETRDVIPLYENVLYAVALVSTLSKEKAEKGLLFLERLFHFCTDNGFVSYFHDFPIVYQDRTNALICLTLTYFLEQFGRLIPKASRLKVEKVQSKLVAVLEKRPLKEWDTFIFSAALGKKVEMEPKTLPEFEIYILCMLLLGEKIELPWHKELGVYAGPLTDTYYKEQFSMPSIVSQLVTKGAPHSSALRATLLAKLPVEDLISFPAFDREDLLIHQDGDLLAIYFGKHSFVAKGELEVVEKGDHLDIFAGDFEELDFFFSDYLESKVLVEGEKATAFYPKDRIELITEEKTLSICFSAKTPFVGHIMKGNRLNQLENVERNFALFDHKITLKKVLK
ncbi:hypothetical protein K0U07_03500 [bacterium]|nr:hypothetical protein [bacterium]